MEKGDQRDTRKDTTKKNGPLFKEGAKIEAKDHQGDKWWEAKVWKYNILKKLPVVVKF
jgi:hypothetical protein